MTTSVVLNKEVVATLAANPAYNRFAFLGPVRTYARTASKVRSYHSGCSSCQHTAPTPVSDAQLDALLSSLDGGAYANELDELKLALGVQVVFLPYTTGSQSR